MVMEALYSLGYKLSRVRTVNVARADPDIGLMHGENSSRRDEGVPRLRIGCVTSDIFTHGPHRRTRNKAGR
jgi:hypothetical protein